jgi:hypothetical protein
LIDVEAALNPEKLTVSLALHNIPLESLERVLKNMAEPAWRRNFIDGINGALAAKDMGIATTSRIFSVRPDD